MRTSCWRMPYSAQYARQLRGVCHAEPSRRWRIHPSMARAAPQRPRWAARGASRAATALRSVRRRNQLCCPSVATEHRVLPQRSAGPCDDANHNSCHSVATVHRVLPQRSAGSCDDATNTVAHMLQRRIACCNSAQCDIAELLHESAVCCNSAPHVATAYDSVAEQFDAPLVAARCSGAACCNACCNAVQPAVAQPNLLRKAHGNSDAAQYVAAQCRVATDRSPLQQTAAPVQPAAVSSTQRRQHAHGTGRACYNTAARLVAAHDDLLQRSAARCNRPQQFATDCSPLQPVAAMIATQCDSLQSTTGRCKRPQPVATDHSLLQPVAAMIATQCDPLQQTSSATGCNTVPSVATCCRLLQPVADCCNLLQRLQRSAVRCNRAQPVATVCDALRGVPGLRRAGVRLQVAQPVATQPPRPVRAVAP